MKVAATLVDVVDDGGVFLKDGSEVGSSGVKREIMTRWKVKVPPRSINGARGSTSPSSVKPVTTERRVFCTCLERTGW